MRTKSLSLLAPVALAFVALSARASDPASQDVTLPSAVGQVVVVEWTGTVKAGTNPASDCVTGAANQDGHVINLTVPDGAYDSKHVSALFHIDWDDTAQDLILSVSKDGSAVASSDGGSPVEEVNVKDPAAGSFSAVACPSIATAATSYRGKLTLTAKALDAAGGGVTLPPQPVVPGLGRFIAENAPVGYGDNVQGEFNIGFNPKTKRLMTLGSTQTLRVTLPEYLTPALPEVCDALWEDKSDTLTGANTNDPILWTDHDTGRTFVSQLILGGAGESVFAYTDDDGDTWSHAPSTIDGAFDHQTVATGPYAAGGSPSGAFPNPVYYCSQQDAFDTCIRSDDGGLTFGAPSKVYDDVTDCPGETNGQHGHLKVAPDGTVYLPRRSCAGTQVVSVSTDNAKTWTVKHIPGSESFQGSDPSIGMASDGTTYFCYANASGSVHVQVSHDHGDTWVNDFDISAAPGVVRGVFPEAVAGDPNRAACGFLGTDVPGNYQAADFPGIWYLYMAMTYDGGHTWKTVRVSDDPVQGAGGICTNGTTCGTNRNLLDFNEVTMDDRGRVMFGFDDGCLGSCSIDPTKINEVAKSSVARQIGGRSLLAAFDPVEPAPPKASCLAGTRTRDQASLTWRPADNGGAAISGYKIFRGLNADVGLQQIAQTGKVTNYVDSTANPTTKYYYVIKAVNASGDGIVSNALALDPSTVVPESPCTLPGVTLYTDPPGDSTAPAPASQDLLGAFIAEPADMPGKLVITMKVGAFTGTPPPGTRWVTYFSPADGNSYYVSMDTASGVPAFSYGTTATISAPAASVGQFHMIGALDAASNYNADGTITLIIDEANIGSPAASSLLGSIHSSVRTMTQNASGGEGLTLDGSSQGLYYFRGACGAAGGVVPGVTGTVTAVTRGRFGGAMGGGVLMLFAGLGLLGRRRQKK